jgi:hypothetical protein
MDLYEKRLQQLEIDYRETISAGAGTEYEYHLVSCHDAMSEVGEVPECIETPRIDDVGECAPHRREVPSLTCEEVSKIQGDMKSIELKYKPSWGEKISDEQIARMLKSMID